MALLDETLNRIIAPDQEAAGIARARLDSLTKPRGSLGRLEDIAARFAAIRRNASPAVAHPVITVFVADHGIADEGVSAYPKAVTVEMLRNLASGGAAICVLARKLGYELQIVDVGVETDTSSAPLPGVLYRRLGAGTRNFMRGPAMSSAEARRALEVGIEVASEAAARGSTTVGIGEMGIANSTSAAAILASLTQIAPGRLAGRGTGLDDAGLKRKVEVIERALELHRASLGDPLATLAVMGGFEIAAMAGVCIGAAASRVAVVVDGFIATAAAALAARINPHIFGYLFFAHRSAEGGHALALEALGAEPILDLGMRLGEGTGAALAMSVIESALALYTQMATFASASVSEKIR
ncbi:MAG TPA: nicotinate-nucleotide--dimethylbenzimidazole phosphoribosyltransferase [Candidatus Binataceae bacterium]|nr:nicotinate-nucleotide--dimethylbenzimidazole phosphoribosyltransferase [Candidatus Binataceae bacterium]